MAPAQVHVEPAPDGLMRVEARATRCGAWWTIDWVVDGAPMDLNVARLSDVDSAVGQVLAARRRSEDRTLPVYVHIAWYLTADAQGQGC
jgi:hypothetical protein